MQVPHKFKEQMSLLEDTGIEGLERKDELGTQFAFTEAAAAINRVYENMLYIYKNMENINVPIKKIDQATAIVRMINEIASAIRAFDLKGASNPSDSHKAITDRARNMEEQAYDQLEPVLTQMKVDALNSYTSESGVDTLLSGIMGLKDEVEVDVAKATNSAAEAQKAAQEARDLFGERGVEISRSDFEAQANYHQGLGKKWLLAFMLSLILALVCIVELFGPSSMVYNEDIDPGKFIEILIFRVLVLSVIFGFISQAVKNYQVHRHLYVVNRHRQLAMTVYPYMTKASSEATERNAIITQAAKAIFEQGSSGYLTVKSEQSMPINLTEIINHLPKS